MKSPVYIETNLNDIDHQLDEFEIKNIKDLAKSNTVNRMNKFYSEDDCFGNFDINDFEFEQEIIIKTHLKLKK